MNTTFFMTQKSCKFDLFNAHRWDPNLGATKLTGHEWIFELVSGNEGWYSTFHGAP